MLGSVLVHVQLGLRLPLLTPPGPILAVRVSGQIGTNDEVKGALWVLKERPCDILQRTAHACIIAQAPPIPLRSHPIPSNSKYTTAAFFSPGLFYKIIVSFPPASQTPAFRDFGRTYFHKHTLRSPLVRILHPIRYCSLDPIRS
ncbi:hypothetical protein BX600DRAFT_289059 [Xylariales sp. PMI_506]|nr:hypothetical protein BX600DRAFT_289059 [Xylariales sp. PMI_506]